MNHFELKYSLRIAGTQRQQLPPTLNLIISVRGQMRHGALMLRQREGIEGVLRASYVDFLLALRSALSASMVARPANRITPFHAAGRLSRGNPNWIITSQIMMATAKLISSTNKPKISARIVLSERK
jgi:hypothetical protein